MGFSNPIIKKRTRITSTTTEINKNGTSGK